MELIITFIVWAFGAISSLSVFKTSPLNLFFSKQATIISELGPQLSPNASILLPGSTEFTDAATRWQQYRKPDVNVVVQVTNEHDIQRTILYANNHNISYLAKVGGHGAIDSLDNMRNGIQISMRPMNHVRISSDGKTATIGGGVKVKEVTDALWAASKQTVTGACECVGMLGPMLGGGFGFLQGQHGLLIDQLVEARMVLANGTAVTASETSHPDLFWTIRGAGHNFGIITEFTYKIYEVVPDSTWAYEVFMFTGDKLKALYSLTNEMMKTQPPQVVNWSMFLRLPPVDPTNPIILYYILYDGPGSAELAYSTPIHALDPINVQAGEVPYPQLSAVTAMSNDDFACQPGATAMRFPINLESYDVPSLRLAYDGFSEMMERVPAFNNSLVLLEGYSMQAVRAVPAENTAFPFRGDSLLLSPVILYQPNSSLDASAVEFGQSFRGHLRKGSKRSEQHSYINYAHGDEDLESMYGYEPWRLEKLRRLKKEYDPEGKFSFYAPIV